MPNLAAVIPPTIHLSVALDRTLTIRSSVSDVQRTLLISIGLVIAVVFVFLRDWRSTLIPSVAVPISLIGTFGVMYLAGYSLDNLSLMALTISTGFVVDDAIVVIENIARHLEMGMTPLQAAFAGAAEIGPTVISITISLVAVFLPILLMAGIVGRLFHEFAVTLSVAIAISLVISLTTTPMMCALLLRDESKVQHGRLYRASEWFFDRILAGYKFILGGVMHAQLLTLLLTLGTIAVTIWLYIHVPKGFFPQQDTGRLQGAIQADQSISFQAMENKLNEIVATVRKDPAVAIVVAFTGGSGGGGSAVNTGRMFVTLKPLAERKIGPDLVIARIRRRLANFPGATLFLQATQDLRIGGRQSNAQYQYTLQDSDLTELNTWGTKMLANLEKLKGLTDVSTDLQNHGLSEELSIDRLTASRLGITPQSLDNTLYDAFGQRQVSVMYTPLNQYHVVMEVEPQFLQNPSSLRYIYLNGTNGSQVPLSTVSKYVPATTPIAISHQSQIPSVTLSFNVAPGVALGDAVESIDGAERQSGLPATIQTSYQGAAQAYQDSLSTEPILIAAALVTVYIVLGILYESLIHPITILSTIPSAGVGALLALQITHVELTVIATIGIILLIGIVKKNAILMIDFAIALERNEGKSPEEAIWEAALLRFRPITMTTMAALYWEDSRWRIGGGVGSELRRNRSALPSLADSFSARCSPYSPLPSSTSTWIASASASKSFAAEAPALPRIRNPPRPDHAQTSLPVPHLVDHRLHRRPEIQIAACHGPNCLQGTAARIVQGIPPRQAQRRRHSRQVVGTLRRPPAQRPRRAGRHQQPDHRPSRGNVRGDPRQRATGPRRPLPHHRHYPQRHALPPVSQ